MLGRQEDGTGILAERPVVFDDQADREAMRRIARGDAGAFEALYRTYEKPVGHFLFRMLYDVALTEDCLQETFLRLWKSAAHWRGESKVSSFIFQIAKNLALDLRQKTTRERARLGGESENGERSAAQVELRAVSAPESGPQGAVESEELRVVVRAALEALPEDLRVIVHLAQTEGLTYREVAEVLAIPVGTVKSRMAAAAEILRRKLRRHVRE